jgi:predicted restriction endonuclease
MSGLPEKRLLNASHIVPWSKDKANRLNPSNGLCLSAIHDKAFDRGLITLTDDFRVLVSNQLKKSNHPFLNDVLVSLDGKPIDLPERFTPNVEFVSYHRKNIFSESYL